MPAATPPLPALTPVICGPTAGGKSDLALDLALTLRDRFGIPAEIVTADAFQVYRGLDIGTAKPMPEERRGVPHHLIDIVHDPGSFTLDDWLTLANQTIADLRVRGILPIVVGGTHLYVKALLEGLFESPEPDAQLREELLAMDPAARRAELESVDPQAAARIHPNDTRRTVRALEVFRQTGQPISAHQRQWDQVPTSHLPPPTSHFLLVILDWETEPLNRRINARVKCMMDRGLLEEVRALAETGALTPQSAEALGYKQLLPVVRQSLVDNTWPPPAPTLEAAVEQVKIQTRRFAKNQRTWLRRLSTTPGAIRLPLPTTPPEERLPPILRALGVVESRPLA